METFRDTARVVRNRERSPLSLLFVTGSLYAKENGPFHSLLETVRQLRAQGHSTLVLGTKDRAEQSSFPSCWPNAVAFRKLGPYSWHYSPDFRSWMNHLGQKVDVVSLQSLWNHNNFTTAKWCVKRGIPYVITTHGNCNPRALSISRWKKGIAKCLYVDYVLKNVSCFHALNEAEYAHIRAYGLKQPVCIVPNGANLPEPDSGPGVATKKPFKTCLYMGRLHPIKNLDTLIRAWHATGSDRTGWKLVLVGPDEGGYRGVLEELVSFLGLDDVAFLGSLTGDDKDRCFRAADCFVLPSLSEGASIALLEAFSHGLPAVLTNRCNFPEGARAGAAIEVSPRLSDLQSGLTTMLKMTDLERVAVGRRARHLISQQYQWRTVAGDLSTIYSWLARHDSPPPCVRFA